MSYLSIKELATMGLRRVGINVAISRYARLYNPGNIIIGNNVRIDDFCLLSSGTEPFIIDNFIHIAAGVYVWGNAGFHIKSFSNISAGTKIYTQSDSYCGNYLMGPTVPMTVRKVKGVPLTIEKHVILGAGVIVLPGVKLGEGVAIGSNSLVIKDCEPWGIYAGSPAKRIKEREKGVINLAQKLA